MGARSLSAVDVTLAMCAYPIWRLGKCNANRKPDRAATEMRGGGTEMCELFGFAVSFELYWPYFVYCCGLLAILGRTIWSMQDGRSTVAALRASVIQLLQQALWRMFLKMLSFWLIGGSLFFAFGVWLCKVV